MSLTKSFYSPTLPSAFYGLNEPARFQLGAGREIFPDVGGILLA